MTWSLWKALRAPNLDHPLYQRLTLHRVRVGAGGSWQSMFMLSLVALFFFLLIIAPMLLIVLLVASPIFYVALTSTFFGIVTTVHISGAVARERLNERYDLLCLTPDGGLEVNWMIFSVRVHQEEILQKGMSECESIVRVLVGLAVVTLVASLASLAAAPPDASLESNRVLFVFCVLLVALSAMVYLDTVQSFLVGGLLGLVVGNITRSLSDARLWSTALFLTQQIVVYAVVLLIGVVAVPVIAASLGLPEWMPPFLTPPLMVLCLYAIREIIIRELWRWLSTRLNADFTQKPNY